MAPSNEDRLNRLEDKLDRLQETQYDNHLELVSLVRTNQDITSQRLVDLEIKTIKHDGYFSMVVKALGAGGLISGWLGLKDLFGGK